MRRTEPYPVRNCADVVPAVLIAHSLCGHALGRPEPAALPVGCPLWNQRFFRASL